MLRSTEPPGKQLSFLTSRRIGLEGGLLEDHVVDFDLDAEVNGLRAVSLDRNRLLVLVNLAETDVGFGGDVATRLGVAVVVADQEVGPRDMLGDGVRQAAVASENVVHPGTSLLVFVEQLLARGHIRTGRLNHRVQLRHRSLPYLISWEFSLPEKPWQIII